MDVDLSRVEFYHFLLSCKMANCGDSHECVRCEYGEKNVTMKCKLSVKYRCAEVQWTIPVKCGACISRAVNENGQIRWMAISTVNALYVRSIPESFNTSRDTIESTSETLNQWKKNKKKKHVAMCAVILWGKNHFENRRQSQNRNEQIQIVAVGMQKGFSFNYFFISL